MCPLSLDIETMSGLLSYGLGDTEISAMLQDAIGSTQEDMLLRALREAQVDARRMNASIRKALAGRTMDTLA